MDILKSKLNLKSGKQLLIIVASLVAALVTIYVAYTSISRNISFQSPESKPGAANPSCLLNLSLNKPSPSPTPIACVDDTDIALVIDRSSTMTDTEADGRTKLTWAKEAAVAFVDAVAASGKTNIRISVSSFGSQGNSGTRAYTTDYDSTLDISLTNNYAAVKSAINGIVYKHSGTCIQCGLRIGNDTLLTPSTTHPKFTILLSDGMANHRWEGIRDVAVAQSLAIEEANIGRAGGIIYYAIGYGTGSQISPSTLISIAGTSANYVYKPNVTDWAGAFVSLLGNICAVPGSTPSPVATATKSPSPKPATPSPVATATKSPSPKPATPSPVAACTNWGVDEKSGTGSTLIKIDSALSSVTSVKNYLCTSGYCEIESMDYNPNNKTLFVVPNIAPTKGLYKVNTSTTDTIADGTITLFKAFSPAFDVNGLSFKNTDSTKAWLWRNGYGLYNMNLSTGVNTLELSYTTYKDFESIVWDNAGRYMYASRGNQLWRYDSLATSNKFTLYASNLPGKTDAMDFAPAPSNFAATTNTSYLNGLLVGYSETGLKFFTYDVLTKSVVASYPKIGNNTDALSVCIPN